MNIRISLIWMLAAAISFPTLAQRKCSIENTVVDCWQKILPAKEIEAEAVADVKAKETEKGKDDLKNAPAGTDTGNNVTASTVKNFLPLLNISGLLGVEEDEETGTMTADLNFLLPSRIREKNGQLQAVVDTEPSLFEPLAMALKSNVGEDAFDETVGDLEKDFGNYDDVKVAFTYNLISEQFGRSFKKHAPQYEVLFNAIEAEQSEAPAAALFAFLMELQEGNPSGGEGEPEGSDPPEGSRLSLEEVAAAMDFGEDSGTQETFVDLAMGVLRFTQEEVDDDPDKKKLVEERARSLMLQLEQSAEKEAQINARIVAAVQHYRLPSFSKLIDNKPQLHISASKHFREDLAGPDETSVNVTWERPMAPNLADFNAELWDTKGIRCQQDARTCLEAFRNFVNKNRDAMEQGDRFSFSLEYMDADELAIDLPDLLTEPFHADATEKLIVTAGWSRQINPNDHLAVSASWEDVSDDPMRQDRGIARATLTRKLSDSFSMPVSLVYATKSEFLDGLVDERVSAHVGIAYRISSPSNSE